MTFLEFYNKMLEQVTSEEVKSIVQAIVSTVGADANDLEIRLVKNVLEDPTVVHLDIEGNETNEGEMEGEDPNLVYNLRRFVGFQNMPNLKDAQALAIGYSRFKSGRRPVVVLLGWTKDNKKVATISVAYPIAGKGIVKAIGSALESHGFKLFTHPHDLEPTSSVGLADKLTAIFRKLSSGSYSGNDWLNAIKQADQLAIQEPEEWAKMKQRYRQIYGNRKLLYRSMGVQPNRVFYTVGNKQPIEASQLEVGTQVYFPAKNPWVGIQMFEMPQGSGFNDTFSDVDMNYRGSGSSFASGDKRQAAHVWAGTGGSGPVGLILRCSVPVDRIIYSSMALMVASPYVKENEVIVKHEITSMPGGEADFGIPCVVVQKLEGHKGPHVDKDYAKVGQKYAQSAKELDQVVGAAS